MPKFAPLNHHMSDKKTSSLEKIGYIKTLPKDADINDYESISIKKPDEKPTTLYRFLETKNTFDDTSNFSNSWDVFNSFL